MKTGWGTSPVPLRWQGYEARVRCAWMTRERALAGVFGLANFVMALSFGWAVVAGDDDVPGAVIVAGGIGGFFVVGETVWYFVHRRNDPDREFR